uniref:hypothetical protein n=1 Tax=Kitasatospora sp. NBC_01519 TaxID=2903576 RepID=UPI002F9113D3
MTIPWPDVAPDRVAGLGVLTGRHLAARLPCRHVHGEDRARTDRLGEDNITSVEVDPDIAARHRRAATSGNGDGDGDGSAAPPGVHQRALPTLPHRSRSERPPAAPPLRLRAGGTGWPF